MKRTLIAAAALCLAFPPTASGQEYSDDEKGLAICVSFVLPGAWHIGHGQPEKGAAMLGMTAIGSLVMNMGYQINAKEALNGGRGDGGNPLLLMGGVLALSATGWAVSDAASRDWAPVRSFPVDDWRPGSERNEPESDFWKAPPPAPVDASPLSRQDGDTSIVTVAGPKPVKLQQPIAITLKDGSVEKGFLDAVSEGFVQLRDTEGRTRRIRESDVEDVTQF